MKYHSPMSCTDPHKTHWSINNKTHKVGHRLSGESVDQQRLGENREKCGGEYKIALYMCMKTRG